MKFTYKWLLDHLETACTLQEIVDGLTRLGIEVESVEDPAKKLSGIVLGYVKECTQHPNADRLRVCHVDIGKGDLVQVVCGASNARQGIKVAFASIGAVIPINGEALKKGSIRGVESQGMLCSGRELCLSEDHEGILELTTDLPLGTPIVDVFDINDSIIDVSITPNRGDCFSVRGLARDLAAGGYGQLKPCTYPTQLQEKHNETLQVDIEAGSGCHAFMGYVIKNVTNRESPKWVQKRLKAIGLRLNSALVDVTNYITYDIGRPLHAFDYDKLSKKLLVRSAKENETFIALNGKEYSLKQGMIVLADTDHVLSLVGVMGGEETSCTPETTNVFLEAALFDPIKIAKTGQQLTLTTDARMRFERGVNPETVDQELTAAASLIVDWCGGDVGPLSRTKGDILPTAKPIIWDDRLFEKKIGYAITDSKKYLEGAGFIWTESHVQILVTPPAWRHDITIPEDIIEELVRLHGYHHIPEVRLPKEKTPKTDRRISGAKDMLVGRGFQETLTFTFIKKEKAQLFQTNHSLLELSNPLTNDLTTMRPSILPSLLNCVVHNINYGTHHGAFFEVSTAFGHNNNSTVTENHMTAVRFGQTHDRHWADAQRDCDVYDIKADLLSILPIFGMSKIESLTLDTKDVPSYYHPHRSATVKQGQKKIASFGELHPYVLKDYELEDKKIVCFEFYLDALMDRAVSTEKTYLPSLTLQSVTRDLAFIAEQSLPAGAIISAIRKAAQPFVKTIEVFDVYSGKGVPEGYKSIACSFVLEPQKDTFTDEQIQDIMQKMIANVEKLTGSKLRQ